MAKKNRTPNEERSTVKKPTSKEYTADQANQHKQSEENNKQVPKKPGTK